MNRNHLILTGLIVLEILVLFLGCRGDSENPMSPTPTYKDGYLTDVSSPDPSGEDSVRTAANPPTLWGLYHIEYMSADKSFEIIPLRGPAFAINVVFFLQPPAGSQYNMGIDVLDDSDIMTDGSIDIRVNLHHPFPGQKQYTGFDVSGILITESSLSAPQNSSLTYADPETDPVLLNPDGHTRWMNPTEFLSGNIFGFEPGWWGTSESSENSGFVAGATLNPYKYFAHQLGPDVTIAEWLDDPESLEKRGMFPSGATCSRDYELKFPLSPTGSPQLMFNYAVLANWAEPIVDPVEDPLSEFPPEANAQYPLHILVTDNSEVFYTPELSGGLLSFDIEIFDWDGLENPAGIPGEVTAVNVWSDESLVPGGSASFMSDEGDWNSGFVASTSVVTIEIWNAVPNCSGESHVWIEIESTNPNSYDQGFDCEFPDDPLAAYVKVPITISNCPKAYMDMFNTSQAGQNSTLDDVEISGLNFVDGGELGVWFEQVDSEGEVVFTIEGTDVNYLDSGTLTADFDFTDAVYGTYEMGCINGCGEITTPAENAAKDQPINVEVLPETPSDLYASTGRTNATPASIEQLSLNWDSIDDAIYYNVYYRHYDASGNLSSSGLTGNTTMNHYDLLLSSIPFCSSGTLIVGIKSVVLDGADEIESLESNQAYLMFHGFEDALGEWQIVSEDGASMRFVRSNVNCTYNSSWGIKALGIFPSSPPLWTILATPPIPEEPDFSHVNFEFLHRHQGLYPSTGYQAGICTTIPNEFSPDVSNYSALTETSYGYSYNDTDSSALMSEFDLDNDEDDNFSSNLASYTGWYLSGFDASDMIDDDESNYLVIALAGDYFDLVVVHIEEVAVVMY